MCHGLITYVGSNVPQLDCVVVRGAQEQVGVRGVGTSRPHVILDKVAFK
jgi:hypothetical protein